MGPGLERHNPNGNRPLIFHTTISDRGTESSELPFCFAGFEKLYPRRSVTDQTKEADPIINFPFQHKNRFTQSIGGKSGKLKRSDV